MHRYQEHRYDRLCTAIATTDVRLIAMAQVRKISMDWRVALGLILTLSWITCGMFYLTAIVGLDQFIHLPTADIGSFLEGAFAPLAFLWLVIGHFMQQKEIAANTRAIGIQEASARRLEVHSQRDSYFKLHELVQNQLGAIAGFLYMSVAGPTGSGEMSEEEFTEQRNHAASGDPAWFVRKLIGLAVKYRHDPGALRDLFFGSEIRTRHAENFVHTFDKLLTTARSVDTEELITDALLNGSASGILYRMIRHASGEEPIDPMLGFSERQQTDLQGRETAETD